MLPYKGRTFRNKLADFLELPCQTAGYFTGLDMAPTIKSPSTNINKADMCFYDEMKQAFLLPGSG